MRISLDSGNASVLEGSTREVQIHKKDASKHIGKSTAGVIDDYDGDKTTITSFDDMLNQASEKIMAGSDSDKITQASELSVKKLVKLYKKLGIKTASGDDMKSYDFVAKKANGVKTDDTTAANAVKAQTSTETSEVNAAQSTSSDNVDYSSYSTETSYKVPENEQSIFKAASDKYGIPYELLTSVACAESDFNPKCTSKSGAMGIMQLMPETAKYLGVKDAYDPEQNIMGGARYLSEKLKQHGSVKLALAAYNAGSNAVEKYNGVPPYTETQNYVKRILGYLGTDGSESGFTNVYANSAAAHYKGEDFQYVAAPDDVPDSTVIQIGENNAMNYSSYLKYVDLIG